MQNLLNVLLSVVIVFLVLILTELLWRHHRKRSEDTRKIVHIFVASFVAFWPYYMSYNQVVVLGLAFLLVIVLSRYFHIFKSIHSIKRKSQGEIMFPLAIIILALIEPTKAYFTIAMLVVGLSDGLAAVIGQKAQPNYVYKVFKQKKSIIGTLTFFATTIIIMSFGKYFASTTLASLSWIALIVIAVIASVGENVAVLGSDDLLVPLIMLVGLRWF